MRTRIIIIIAISQVFSQQRCLTTERVLARRGVSARRCVSRGRSGEEVLFIDDVAREQIALRLRMSIHASLLRVVVVIITIPGTVSADRMRVCRISLLLLRMLLVMMLIIDISVTVIILPAIHVDTIISCRACVLSRSRRDSHISANKS